MPKLKITPSRKMLVKTENGGIAELNPNTEVEVNINQSMADQFVADQLLTDNTETILNCKDSVQVRYPIASYLDVDTNDYQFKTEYDKAKISVVASEVLNRLSIRSIANEEGEATLTIKAKYKEKAELTKQITVKLLKSDAVIQPDTPVEPTPPEIGISVEPTTLELIEGAKHQILITVANELTDYDASISDDKIISFDKDTTTVTAIKPGSATLTLTAKQKASAKARTFKALDQEVVVSVTVTAIPVVEHEYGVEVDKSAVTLQEGKSETLNITVVEGFTDFKGSVADKNIATFDKDSKTITAVKAGNTTIGLVGTKEDGSTAKNVFTVTVNVEAATVEPTPPETEDKNPDTGENKDPSEGGTDSAKSAKSKAK